MPEVMHCLRLDIHLQELPDMIERRLLQHIYIGHCAHTPGLLGSQVKLYRGRVGIGVIFRVDAQHLHMLRHCELLRSHEMSYVINPVPG